MSLQGQATGFDDYLNGVERSFDAAPPGSRYAIVAKPLNREYLRNLSNIEELDEKLLTEGVGEGTIADANEENINYKKTNAFQLAVSLGRDVLVEKFLSVIPDLQDDHLTAWGYRQPYSPAHMAVNPVFPYKHTVPLENRLRIIDLLAENRCDFNVGVSNKHNGVYQIGVYTNQPLWAAGNCDWCVPQNILPQLRARAMIYGADPKMGVTGLEYLRVAPEGFYSLILGFTLDYFVERAAHGAHLTPTDYVMMCLKEFSLSKFCSYERRERFENALKPRLVKEEESAEKARVQIIPTQVAVAKNAEDSTITIQTVARGFLAKRKLAEAKKERAAEEARVQLARITEEARIAEEVRLAKEARFAEEDRLAAELAEKLRLAEVARLAKEAQPAEAVTEQPSANEAEDVGSSKPPKKSWWGQFFGFFKK